MGHEILWRGSYLPGHEACRLYRYDVGWRLEGTAVFLSEGRPCRLSYLILCDASWKTLEGSVSGWFGEEMVSIELAVDANQHWQLNGKTSSAVDGCIDLDLNFSPVTNLLPIRRLNLEIGEHAEVNAAWLRFPSFELERLPQIYTRLDESTYRYSSGGGEFIRDLTVNESGFVTNYPEFWQVEE